VWDGVLQLLLTCSAVRATGAATELALTAREVCGAEAQQLGLVARCLYDQQALMAAARQLAATLACKPSLALVGTKRVMLHARCAAAAGGGGGWHAGSAAPVLLPSLAVWDKCLAQRQAAGCALRCMRLTASADVQMCTWGGCWSRPGVKCVTRTVVPACLDGTFRFDQPACCTHCRDHNVAEGLEYIATWNSGMLISEDMRRLMAPILARQQAGQQARQQRSKL
jgi:hypothetical protein